MKAEKIKVPKTAKELKLRLDEVENDDSIKDMKYDLQIALIKSFAKQYADKVSREREKQFLYCPDCGQSIPEGKHKFRCRWLKEQEEK